MRDDRGASEGGLIHQETAGGSVTTKVAGATSPSAPTSTKARRKNTAAPVAIVSAGPGDPDLLTVRAVTLLKEADFILADSWVVPVAELYAGENTRVAQAVDGDGNALEHAECARLVIEAAREGLRTVRLLGGDPVVDGSIVHEAAALKRAKVMFEIAPGVSEVTAVPAYAGFGLVGGRVRSFRVVDAHDPELPWAELVHSRMTIVFLNGADRSADIAGRLLKAGADPGTQVAVTRRGTTVDQRTVTGVLEEIGLLAKSTRTAGPGIMVVGDVVGQRERLDWFEVKSLFGWRILIPRTQESGGPLLPLLRLHGAVPLEVPTISVEPPRTPQQMDRALHGLVGGRYEWIAFTSVNAVRAIREKLAQYGLDARSFAGLKVAAVGEPTIAALLEFGVRPDLVSAQDQSTAGLLAEWPPYDELTDPINRVFLPRADIATDSLAAGLAELGWEVEDITAYRTVRAAPPHAEVREAIKTGGFDAVVFTSSSTVRNLVGIAGKPHHSTIVACIGPQTARTAEEHGLRVDVLATVTTPQGLVEALAEYGEELRHASLEAGEESWRPSRRRVPPRRK
jgi:uroporphyrinogen III methyltransferase/synthase